MRIAVVTESFLPRTDGVVRTVLAFLEYLHQHGHQALVFAAGPGPTAYDGYPVVRVRGIRFPLYPALTLAPHSTHMRRRMREFRPDLVHLASPFVLGVQGRLAGRSQGVPVVAHYQTDLVRYARHFRLGALAGVARWHLARLHNGCQANYAPTPSVRDELLSWGVREARVSGRGVDATLFNPAKRSEALRHGLLLAGEHTLFLYVGRLSVEKNLESLVPMLAGTPGCRLVLVGEGPLRASLEARFSGLPATFLGLKRGEELAQIYASADVLTFPSLTETFGQVVQEAMASGLPVLACRAGGVQDLFRDGAEGYLCQPGDAGTWLDRARRLGGDAALRGGFGRQARASAASRTWDMIFDHLLGDYRELLRSGGEPPNVASRIASASIH